MAEDLNYSAMMTVKNEAGLVNFVCTNIKLGDKTFTLPSMENLIVECNLKDS